MKKGNMRKYFPYGQIVLACLIWGSYGLFVQKLDEPPEVIVFFRFLFGFFSLVIVALLTGRIKNLHIGSQWKVLVLAGLINTASWLLVTKSIRLTGVANGFILYYTAPCFVVLLAPFLLKEKVGKWSFVALALCFFGIINVVGWGGWDQVNPNWQGNLMGLGSGFFYALYIILLKMLPEEFLGLVSNCCVCGVISSVTFFLAAPNFALISLADLLVLALAGIIIQGIATTCYMNGLRRVSAQDAGILCYMELLFASLLAAIFLKENVSTHLVMGGLLIICGGVLVVFAGSKEKQIAEEK